MVDPVEVVAAPADHQVGAVLAVEDVGAVIAVKGVGDLVAVEIDGVGRRVQAGRQDLRLDPRRQAVADAREHPVEPLARRLGHPVARVVNPKKIVAGSALKTVDACVADQHIVAIAAHKNVVTERAIDMIVPS